MNVTFSKPGNRVVSICVLMMAQVLFFVGCSNIADPDRQVIAEFNGDVIRRSDLKKVIREMSDEERPLIQTRDDLLDTLNGHINKKIMADIAKELRREKEIEVPREQARAVYFTKNPEFVNVDRMTDPSVMNITQGELVALQAEMEFGIDDELEILYREAAYEYRIGGYIQEFMDSGERIIQPEELVAEYERRKKSLMTLEAVDFIAIRFPQGPGAQQEAVKARGRIDNGESFNDVLDYYMKINENFGMRAAFENNPVKPRFQQFWYTVTGCSRGDILGPVFLPAYDQVGVGPDGKDQIQRQPDSWVVLEVQDRLEPREKTLQESEQDLTMPILADKVMANMRNEYGVVVYPDRLWRPEGFGDQFKGSMIRTKSQ